MHHVQRQDYKPEKFDKWIGGADSVCNTNVLVHAESDQHVHAINLLRKQQVQAQGMRVTTYAPIAQSLKTLSEDEWQMIHYGRSLVQNKIDSAQTNCL